MMNMHKNIELKYNDNLCHCLKTFFVNDSNLLAKELLKITHYKQGVCLRSLIDTTKYNYVWMAISSYVEGEVKQLFIHSHTLRKQANKTTIDLNFNYTEDLYVYMQQLATELGQYVTSCTSLEEVRRAHREYYKDMYSDYSQSKYLINETSFIEYVNPLYRFNFNSNYANPWPCIFENNLKVIFIPNINNIIKHAPTS